MRSLKPAGDNAVACAAARKLRVRLATRKHWSASIGGRLMRYCHFPMFGDSERQPSDHSDFRIRADERASLPGGQPTMTRDTYERALKAAAQIAFLSSLS